MVNVIHILSKRFAQNLISTVTDGTRQERWVSGFFRLMAITLGALHGWVAAANHSMNPDGISYLDIGDAYMRGDWNMAINSVWSPMYSWILGPVLHFLNPSMQWEFPVVHLVNFVIYLVALICFEFFWRQVMLLHRAQISTKSEGFPDWALLSLGYLIFVTASLILIEIWAVTPDLLMSAFVYLAAGLVVQIRLGRAGWRLFIFLGLILGLGYLAKAIMFPVAILLLGVALLSVGNVRSAVPRVLLAGLFLLVVIAPYVAMISVAKGRLTIGEAGAFTYAKHVNGIPFHHWQGGTPENGTPLHPTRQIFDKPPIYEFGTPIGGTYPVAYDPSYWYEGLKANFDLAQQIKTLIASALFYYELFSYQFGALAFGVLLLYALERPRVAKPTEIVSRWGLTIVALAVFAFYGIVTVIGRYVGVFVVLFWADLLANVSLPDSQLLRRWVSLLSIIMILFMLINIAAFNLQGFRDLTGGGEPDQLTPQDQKPSWPGEVAEELHRLGPKAGDNVAVIGYGFDSFWARLGRVQIVAEMLEEEADAFWLGDPSMQSEVIRAFATTGAKAIVAEDVPSYASLSGWRQVGNSNYYIYILAQ
jgi:hypothetical protein